MSSIVPSSFTQTPSEKLSSDQLRALGAQLLVLVRLVGVDQLPARALDAAERRARLDGVDPLGEEASPVVGDDRVRARRRRRPPYRARPRARAEAPPWKARQKSSSDFFPPLFWRRIGVGLQPDQPRLVVVVEGAAVRRSRRSGRPERICAGDRRIGQRPPPPAGAVAVLVGGDPGEVLAGLLRRADAAPRGQQEVPQIARQPLVDPEQLGVAAPAADRASRAPPGGGTCRSRSGCTRAAGAVAWRRSCGLVREHVRRPAVVARLVMLQAVVIDRVAERQQPVIRAVVARPEERQRLRRHPAVGGEPLLGDRQRGRAGRRPC